MYDIIAYFDGNRRSVTRLVTCSAKDNVYLGPETHDSAGHEMLRKVFDKGNTLSKCAVSSND